MVGNLWKRKVECSKRLSEKEKKWRNGLEKKEEVEVQFELYCVKLVDLMTFERKIVLH